MSQSPRQVECVIPVLRVQDLARSVRFYTDVLGFTLDWGAKAGDTLGSVSRDGCAIMLSAGSRGQPRTWVWIGLEDDSLFGVVEGRGAKVLQGPKNFPWAYEMKIADPDGHVLWLGTEPKQDLPFASATDTEGLLLD